MFHGLIRLLAWINFFFAFMALLFLPVFLVRSVRWEAGILAVYVALLALSGAGLLRRSGWGKGVTLVLGTLFLAEGAWHLFRREWGLVLFALSYAALVGWLVLHPVNAGYFGKKEAGSGGTGPA